MSNLSIIDAAQPTMSSREIADICNARHNDVVATIDRLFDKNLLRESRKSLRDEKTRGRPLKVYDLTKRDSLLVVSGYKDEVRAAIIDRWVELETQTLSPVELILKQAEQLVYQERRLKVIEDKQEHVDQRLEQLNPDTGYRTISAHGKIIGVKFPLNEAKILGQKAKKLCDAKGLTIGTVSDERFGRVNSYPVDILEELTG